MPDWHQTVQRGLGSLDLSPQRELEIVQELADHLEDRHASLCEQGVTTERALSCALEEIADGRKIAARIRRAEEDDMNERTRSLWLPGVAMLFLSAFILRLVMRAGWQPNVVWISPRAPLFGYTGLALVFYVPWLVMLPAIGALGAWWSRQAGGDRPVRLLSGLFPVVAILALLLLGFLLAPFADPQVPMTVKLAALGAYLLGWVLIPGAALLLGAAPFLRNPVQESA